MSHIEKDEDCPLMPANPGACPFIINITANTRYLAELQQSYKERTEIVMRLHDNTLELKTDNSWLKQLIKYQLFGEVAIILTVLGIAIKLIAFP